VVDDRLAAHDHTGRVHACLADQPFEPARGVDDLADLLLRLVQPADLAGLAVAGVIGIEDAGQRMSLPITAGGNALVIRSPSAYGNPSTRVESFTAALALMVP